MGKRVVLLIGMLLITSLVYAETLEEAEWMMANQLSAKDIANILEAMHKDEDEKKMKNGKKSKEEDIDDEDDED